RHHRLMLDPMNTANPTLRVLDVTTNQMRGQPLQLGNVQTNFAFFQHLYNNARSNTGYHPNARFRFYQGRGHLAVFQVGTMVYGLVLANVKVLWQHPLLEGNPQFQPGTQIQPDAEGNLWLTLFDPNFGQQIRRTQVGHVGAVEASYVSVVSQKGLTVLDPLRGTQLWNRASVAPQSEVFGDDKHVFVVTGSASGITGPSWALRVSDGSVVETRDFTYLYRNRIRVKGSKILAADRAGGKLSLRLYDVVS